MYMNRKFYAVSAYAHSRAHASAYPRAPAQCLRFMRQPRAPAQRLRFMRQPHAPAQPVELARAHANQAHARAHYMSYISSSVSMISDEKVYTMVEQ